MQRIWISIGSNIEPQTHIREALKLLDSTFGPGTVSPVYLSPAEGFDGPPFLNLVAGYDTPLKVEQVIKALASMEDNLGRVRTAEKFNSRTVDLDLLTYGNQVLNVGGKVIPRDEILEYAFVLKPLADVAPDERHPQTGETYAELWDSFTGDREQPSLVSLDEHSQTATSKETS
jgi:2-amino-4-hydroxy-6-hydroxymethyldihydropteridine diphosphokinase